ncbi:MAG TPA: pyrroline-5-carboxylate reductase [Rhizomicrobium sp.]|nr:pyrroline-5-carboxylate reductase [Rhizomicrobium sp.]
MKTRGGKGSIVLIGAGRMGSALLAGWQGRGLGPVIVVEPHPSPPIRKLAKAGTIRLTQTPSGVTAKKIAACVVAIKPQVLKGEAPVLAALARSDVPMISIAAGTSIAALSKAWGAKARIIRAMPNIPGAIGEGISGLYAAKGATASDRRLAASLLSALGEVVWVKRESLIDSVTAISGSGPAYLFLMAEALADAGVAEGLPRGIAEKLARATVSGAGALLKADKSPAAALRAAVTSPGGTTAAALSVLMAEDGLQALIKRAVAAAKKRAEELR